MDVGDAQISLNSLNFRVSCCRRRIISLRAAGADIKLFAAFIMLTFTHIKASSRNLEQARHYNQIGPNWPS